MSNLLRQYIKGFSILLLHIDEKYIKNCTELQILLGIRLQQIASEHIVITNIILIIVILSSNCLMGTIPINYAYSLCKLVPTNITIGFAPVGPKFDQPAGYIISGSLYVENSPTHPVGGKIVKLNSASPKISGSTTTDSGGNYKFFVHPPLGQYKVIAIVGSDKICGPCSEKICIQGTYARGTLSVMPSANSIENNKPLT